MSIACPLQRQHRLVGMDGHRGKAKFRSPAVRTPAWSKRSYEVAVPHLTGGFGRQRRRFYSPPVSTHNAREVHVIDPVDRRRDGLRHAPAAVSNSSIFGADEPGLCGEFRVRKRLPPPATPAATCFKQPMTEADGTRRTWRAQ